MAANNIQDKFVRPPIIARRAFLLGASAAMLCTPAIVRASSLMPLRGVPLPGEYIRYGHVIRMWIFANLGTIKSRLDNGLSAHEIAEDFNIDGRGYANRKPWDAGGVLGIIRLDEADNARPR
jgi:hypothetical protein